MTWFFTGKKPVVFTGKNLGHHYTCLCLRIDSLMLQHIVKFVALNATHSHHK